MYVIAIFYEVTCGCKKEKPQQPKIHVTITKGPLALPQKKMGPRKGPKVNLGKVCDFIAIVIRLITTIGLIGTFINSYFTR
jgi:hypothetical protein